jgi:choline dehydrogenase-like flavoprotein
LYFCFKDTQTALSQRQFFFIYTPKDVFEKCDASVWSCCFGENPTTSVLDINCRTHDVDNLYVVDSSFFPSSTALNLSLTIIVNALQVVENLLEKMK